VARRLLLLSALAWVPGCVLEPLSLEGASCPCADGWVCDEATDTCIEGGGGRCGGGGAVTLSGLRTEWVTPNQARLRWEAEGLDSLFGYEVEIAESEEALLAGELLRTVTSDENPELARGRLLNATDGDPVLATTIIDLDEDTSYRVRLVAEDNAGSFSCSATVGVLTDEEAVREIPLAAETEDGARPRPECVSFEDDPSGAATGDRYWQWVARCEQVEATTVAVCGEPVEPAPDCYENIRIEGLDYPFDLSEGEFQGAFLEMMLEVTGSDHGYWGELGISTPGEGGSGTSFFTRGRLTIASGGGYRRYQVPLRILGGADGRLSTDALNRGVRSFRVGTEWDDGAVVRIDDAAIRW
jgi:hypothetical protein